MSNYLPRLCFYFYHSNWACRIETDPWNQRKQGQEISIRTVKSTWLSTLQPSTGVLPNRNPFCIRICTMSRFMPLRLHRAINRYANEQRVVRSTAWSQPLTHSSELEGWLGLLSGSAKDIRLKWSKPLNPVGTDKTSVAEKPRGLIVSNKGLEISGGSIAREKFASDGMTCGRKRTVKNLIMKSNYGKLTVVKEGLWISTPSSMLVR